MFTSIGIPNFDLCEHTNVRLAMRLNRLYEMKLATRNNGASVRDCMQGNVIQQTREGGANLISSALLYESADLDELDGDEHDDELVKEST